MQNKTGMSADTDISMKEGRRLSSKKQIRFPRRKILWKDLKRILTLNIGTILFGILFVYMMISIVLYLTTVHVTSYQVVAGPLAKNEIYTGLALYKEQVINADASGYISHYAREGGKVSAASIVYGLGEQQVEQAAHPLSEEDLSRIRAQMSAFSHEFDPKDFKSTYDLKYGLCGSILQYSMESQVSTENPSVTMGGQTLVRARENGIVLYSRDGYEDTTVENFTEASLDQGAYRRESLKKKEPIQAGDAVYTLITGETWNLVIPLSDKQASSLADKTYIKVRFLKDNVSQTGDFTIIERDGKKYGNIGFGSGLIRYAGDRFIDIELVTNAQSGLKIPLTSVVNKEFYTIPVGYKTVGGDTGEAGFLVENEKKKGEAASRRFVSTILYGEDEDICYVDKSTFPEGSVLLKPDSNDRYVVGDVAALEGVYCINKGYAVFRFINILDQNEEFCIVAKDTEYGLAQYDHIILDASQVGEEDIVAVQ